MAVGHVVGTPPPKKTLAFHSVPLDDSPQPVHEFSSCTLKRKQQSFSSEFQFFEFFQGFWWEHTFWPSLDLGPCPVSAFSYDDAGPLPASSPSLNPPSSSSLPPRTLSPLCHPYRHAIGPTDLAATPSTTSVGITSLLCS